MIDATATLRGVTIGQAPYLWTAEPAGLLGSAAIRVNDLDRPNRHGIIAGGDFLGSRPMSFEVAVLAESATEVEELLVDLTAAFAPSPADLDLEVRVSGSPAEYRLIGRPRGCDVSLGRSNEMFGGYVGHALCRFTATDPVRYALTGSSLVLALSTPGGGLVYPVVYPVVYGGSGGSGQGDAVNAGTAEVDWSATFTGPLTNPRIEHVDSGRFVRVVQSITAAQTVVLDSARGAVLLNGSAPRPSWVGPGSSWFRLGAGSNLLRFTADSGTGDCTVTWRSGWS